MKEATPTRETKSVEAIAAAQFATREFGMHSIQTIQAWGVFEDIASDELRP